MQLRPLDTLPVGTKVTVDGHGEAEVMQCEYTTDQHNNPIYVHHLKYKDGSVKPCNYSFIHYE